jgi:hypothetical protein
MSLIEALRNGKVDITFKSLTSGQEITKTFTLNTCFKVPQNPQSDKIVGYNPIAKEWEDIHKSTIIEWKIA